jgi:hypothetical protein
MVVVFFINSADVASALQFQSSSQFVVLIWEIIAGKTPTKKCVPYSKLVLSTYTSTNFSRQSAHRTSFRGPQLGLFFIYPANQTNVDVLGALVEFPLVGGDVNGFDSKFTT